jgi:hypothetical protein
MSDHVGANLLDCLLRFGQNFRKDMPHVHHLVPHFEVHVHASVFCALPDSCRIIDRSLCDG